MDLEEILSGKTSETNPQPEAKENQVAQEATSETTTEAKPQELPKNYSLPYSPEEIAKFAKIYEEFTRNPYEFLAKYIPDIFPKDDYSWIKKALAKEFGEDFTPDPNEAMIPGTKSHLYFIRSQQLMLEHENSLKKYAEEVERRKREFWEKFEREKQEVMKKYSLDEEKFKSFWEKLETTDISLDILYRGLFFDELVEKIKQEVAESIKRELSSSVPPSPAQVRGEPKAVDKDLADFGFF